MRSVVVDTNLLLLLVVGRTDRQLIRRHKRTSKFDPSDFDILCEFLARYPRIIVTPNVLTETSNLLKQTNWATAQRLLGTLKALIQSFSEHFVPSADASKHPSFLVLGLADAATLHSPPAGSVLLSDDLDLIVAAERLGRTAINFAHIQYADLQSL